MSSSSSRVATNTGILYARMVITVGVALFTTRIFLNALGSVDYGIFNLLAGVIAMLSFLNTAMAASTQRYLSFYQGKHDVEKQKKVFLNSLILHILIGIIIIIAVEVIGVFLFQGFLKIPPVRIPTAKVIYHFVAITVFINILTVPFTASLNAHENMLWIAVVSITETFLKLGVAYSLLVYSGDKLIVFGLLVACIALISLLSSAIYCIRKYPECKLKGSSAIDKPLMKELISFAGWNLFGTLCTLARAEGLAIILNLFFGAVINAAFGIANTVATQMAFFSVSMLQAINPQIMRSEAEKNRSRMLRLSMMASKFGFFLLTFIALPCIFEMPAILRFWLKNVPANTVIFCDLILLSTMTNQLTIGLQSAVQATGKIKAYQAVVGSLIIFNLPVAYVLLKLHMPAYSVLLCYTIIETVACLTRIYFVKRIAGLSVKEYTSRVFAKEVVPVIASVAACFAITHFLHFNYRFLVTIPVSVIVFVTTIYFSGLCTDEKELIDQTVIKLYNKFIKKKVLAGNV